jgi:predicted acylesterase/phospholipase RssA/CRP-like cAMP-binding protein
MNDGDRELLVDVLTAKVGTDHNAALGELVGGAVAVQLGSGAQLFAQGDHADALFVVASGRLRITRDQPNEPGAEPELLREVGRGSIVGELGIIDDEPRAASVAAVRPSLLFRIDRDHFDQVSEEHPAMVLALFRSLLSSSVKGNRAHDPALSVAVACVGVAHQTVMDALAAELAEHGDVTVVPGPDISSARDHRSGTLLLDMSSGTDGSATLDSGVIDAAIDHADRVAVVLPQPASPEQLRVLDEICQRVRAAEGRTLWVALMHAGSAADIGGAGPLLARDEVDEVHHLRKGSAGDLARLARLLSGNGIGLALGGGGARAYAHVGVLRALAEVGIPIDRVGGTSQGAVIATFHAMGKDPADMIALGEELHESGVVDYTVPLVAFAKGAKLVEKLAMFESMAAENLLLPWFAITTNLTQARCDVQRRGDLRRLLRATVSLPGVFPPVPIEGDLHVDGALFDNVPGDIMAADPTIRYVLAVDVTPPGGPRARSDFGLSVRAVDAVWAKARRKPPLPDVATVLMSSILVGSDRARRSMQAESIVDLYLSLNLKGIGLLQYTGLADIADRGYRDTIEPLTEWWRTTVASRNATS